MTDQQWTMVAGLAAVWLAAYWYSLRRRPYTKCRWCDGSGKVRGWWKLFFPWAWGECHGCSGKGRKQRLGARLLGYGTPRHKQPRLARKNRR